MVSGLLGGPVSSHASRMLEVEKAIATGVTSKVSLC